MGLPSWSSASTVLRCSGRATSKEWLGDWEGHSGGPRSPDTVWCLSPLCPPVLSPTCRGNTDWPSWGQQRVVFQLLPSHKRKSRHWHMYSLCLLSEETCAARCVRQRGIEYCFYCALRSARDKTVGERLVRCPLTTGLRASPQSRSNSGPSHLRCRS